MSLLKISLVPFHFQDCILLAQPDTMASPPDPDAEATRGETSEEGNEASEDGESSLNEEVVEVPDDDESPPNETIVKVSTGQDLTVVLEDKEVKLKIQHDALGRIRVFGLETGDLMPMMVRPIKQRIFQLWVC